MNAKTYTARESEIDRRWFVVDATDQTLGRLASRIARVLEGKHKPSYSPTLDSGDHVIVLNAARITVTSDKLESKRYIRHSGYPQGYREETLGHLLERLGIGRGLRLPLTSLSPAHSERAAQEEAARSTVPFSRVRLGSQDVAP